MTLGRILVALGVLFVAIVYWPADKLLIWPDSIGYLGPAVDLLTTHRLTNWNTSSGGFPYPLFVGGLLLVSPHPWIIVFVQRIVVLIMFGFFASALWIYARRSGREGDSTWTTVLIAGWALTVVLFPPVVGLGQSLMPEALFGCVTVLTMLGVMLVALPDVSPGAKSLAAIWTPFASCAVVLLKPHWLPAVLIVPASLPWLTPRARRWPVAGRVLVGLSLAVVLLYGPEYAWQERSDARFTRVFGPQSLFCNSADLMHQYFSERPVEEWMLPVRDALGDVLTPEARELARRVGWTTLGFSGDNCTHGRTVDLVRAHFGGAVAGEVRFYTLSYLGAVVAHPSYMPKRVVRELSGLAWKPFAGLQIATFLMADKFAAIFEARDRRPLFDDWIREHRAQITGSIEPLIPGALLPMRLAFAAAGLLLSAATVLAWLAIARVKWRSGSLEPDQRVFLVISAAVVSMCLLIAIVHTFDESRYAAMQSPLFSLMGATACLTVARAWRAPGV